MEFIDEDKKPHCVAASKHRRNMYLKAKMFGDLPSGSPAECKWADGSPVDMSIDENDWTTWEDKEMEPYAPGTCQYGTQYLSHDRYLRMKKVREQRAFADIALKQSMYDEVIADPDALDLPPEVISKIANAGWRTMRSAEGLLVFVHKDGRQTSTVPLEEYNLLQATNVPVALTKGTEASVDPKQSLQDSLPSSNVVSALMQAASAASSYKIEPPLVASELHEGSFDAAGLPLLPVDNFVDPPNSAISAEASGSKDGMPQTPFGAVKRAKQSHEATITETSDNNAKAKAVAAIGAKAPSELPLPPPPPAEETGLGWETAAQRKARAKREAAYAKMTPEAKALAYQRFHAWDNIK